MKRLSLFILLSLLSLNLTAQERRTMGVFCAKTEEVLSSLRGKYKEIPLIAGKSLNSTGSTISIWGNPETETFTILDTHGDTTCILGAGTNITILLKEGESI